MKINEARLRRIIVEEITSRLIDQLIVEELDKFLAEIEADWGSAKRKARRKNIRNMVAGTLALTGTAGGMQGQVSDYEDALAADSEEIAQQNVEKSSTIEKSAEDLNKKAGNFISWMWSTTDTQTLPFPTNPANHSEAVLPLEWSVMAQVVMDKKAGTPQYEVNKLYLQAADSYKALAAAYNVKGKAAKGPHKQFFNDFSPESFPFSDASELGAHSFISRVMMIPSAMIMIDGESVQQNLVYVPFDEIPDDYKMPLTGLTKSDLYKKYYYGDGMSLEEFGELKGTTDQDTDQAAAINPEPIKKTNDRADSLQLPKDNFPWKESKNTWRNYKNRKKKFA